MPSKPLLAIVEDDPSISRLLEINLHSQGYETESFSDPALFWEAQKDRSYDLVLLDVMLPGMDGYEIAERLRQGDKETAIIMVTALDEERDKVRGLDAGADDYITKPFSMDELLARVRANLRRVRQRETLADDATIEVGDLVIEPKSFKVWVAGEPVALRLKEYQLLVTLARLAGSLCTRQTLAERVWGYEHLASSRTIDVHIRRLRQAIEEPSAYTYIHTVHGMGYRFEVIGKEGATQ